MIEKIDDNKKWTIFLNDHDNLGICFFKKETTSSILILLNKEW
jgi:hypothetical protein